MFYTSNKLADIKKVMVSRIVRLYPQREAENMANMLIRHYFGLSRTMQQLQIDKRLSESEMLIIDKAVKRLLTAEPIQYVVGSTEFYGLELDASPEVLIPRPETEELVDIIIKDNRNDNVDILDIGTGSGCIALALKNTYAKSRVTAIDISEKALALARKNAENLNLKVDFRQCNILDAEACSTVLEKKFHIIVSNPPYVLQKEKAQMADNVLKYEPPLALFVEDDDPLLFYRKIIRFAERSLRPNGKLYFEINENYAEATASLFDKDTFDIPETMTDVHGKVRFLVVRAN
ncbi:Peptide chain release factor N(5)-glutamine methyltransferase [hydrothermal vent metagenome]|uniref:peptide chain release factor N(5)-glutamine methyltransferase n=1 Tax=hydrothermal vent metagenome TaxID=652676 RepID=A0A3B0ULT1_9ZZZZ